MDTEYLAQIAARATQSLEEDDYRVLHAMAGNLHKREAFPLSELALLTRLEEKQIDFILNKLNSRKLVFSQQRRYILVSLGLDALALHILAMKNSVTGLGKALGVGKEADVYEGTLRSQSRVTLKFYRIGRISFRDVRRKRAYTTPMRQHHWLVVSIKAAQKEISVLRKLREIDMSVPRPIARVFHVVVQEMIKGDILTEIPNIESPGQVLRQVLSEMRRAFIEAGVVNGDLSEFNIMFDGEKAWLIDWPQTIPSSHPNAQQLLLRDVSNVVNFFRRKYGTQLDVEKAVKFVQSRKVTVV